MYLRYIAYELSVYLIPSRCRKSSEVIENRMIALDDKVIEPHFVNCSWRIFKVQMPP